jgi:ABC-type transport system involved in multi-copper enzyme maturation permease subunit
MANLLPTLVRKELLGHMRTLRLVVALVFTVLLCLLTTIMGSFDYSRNMRQYERVVSENRDRMAETRVFERLQPNTVLPPQPVQILCRGIVQAAGQSFDVRFEEYVIGARSLGRSSADDLLFTLAQVDFVAVVSLVLSFLAIALGFDAICGEREQGTLRLLLSHAVPRGQIVAAKLIGGFLSVWTPLAVAYALSLLVLQANPDVEFSGDDWLRLALLFLLTCLFLAEVFALAVLVSACTQRAATSLIFCLFGWLVLGAGCASALPAIARSTLDWPPWMDYVENRNAEFDAYGRQMKEWDSQHPRPAAAAFLGLERDGVLRYAHPSAAAWLDARSAYDFDKILERADRVHRHRTQNQMPLADQQFAVDEWSVLSPITGYRALAKWLARSTLDDAFEVSYHGMRYRRTYIDFLRARFAARGWRRWHTDDPPDTPAMIEDPAAVTPAMLEEGSDFQRQRLAWAEDRWEQDQQDPRRQLDLRDLPDAGPDWQRTTGESIQRMLPGLLIMVLTLGAAVLLTLRRFLTYRLS